MPSWWAIVGDGGVRYSNTLPVTMEDMLHHAGRCAAPALPCGWDMPLMSYQVSVQEAVATPGASYKKLVWCD
jgi:ketopantoate hydroxymethyltransferase